MLLDIKPRVQSDTTIYEAPIFAQNYLVELENQGTSVSAISGELMIVVWISNDLMTSLNRARVDSEWQKAER